MKERLYFRDAWIRVFDARVEAVKKEGGETWLRLSQSAFYPEGGGQPGDRGLLYLGENSYPVTDTQSDEDGQVWHRVQAPEGAARLVPGVQVRGELDWARRHDHMQQHTGEHILAWCVWSLHGGYVHGLHIGQVESSIDVSLPGGQTRLSGEQLEGIETLANRVIARDDTIVCRFPDAGEISKLPLRKMPGEHDQTRVVLMGDYEGVACGGTHLGRTGQAGVIKILRDQSARGKLRLFFLCGLRAARHYQACWRALDEASSILSAPHLQVPRAAAAALERINSLSYDLAAFRKGTALARLPGLLERAEELSGGTFLVAESLPEAEAQALDALASALAQEPGVTALLCAPQGDKALFTFARAEGPGRDLAALMRAAGIRGGGKPAFARGTAGDTSPLETAIKLAHEAAGEAPGERHTGGT
ncbi:MAG: DHHA1 domain-containing protein [Eubacteriales bacterium]|nr:DHHA1 domain-containing protein [Eubacteriales bacterium]